MVSELSAADVLRKLRRLTVGLGVFIFLYAFRGYRVESVCDADTGNKVYLINKQKCISGFSKRKKTVFLGACPQSSVMIEVIFGA